MKYSVLYLLIFSVFLNLLAKDRTDANEILLLAESRKQFSLSIDEEDQVSTAIQLFEQLRSSFPELAGRAEVYLGALEAIKGKHSFWPHQKIAHVNTALKMMNEGLAKSPDDLEALFVHANICYNLPFFFARQDEGRNNYRRIVELMPQKYQDFDNQFIIDVIEYYQLKLDRPQSEMAILEEVRLNILKSNEGDNI